MRRYLLPNISAVLILATTTAILADAEAPNCEGIRAAIREGDLNKFSSASSCAQTAGPQLQADLIKMAIEYRQEGIALALLRKSEMQVITPALIHNAALFEQPQAVKFILEKNPSLLEVRDEAGRTPLTFAALGRAYMAATVLLEHGAHEAIGESLVIAVGRSREIAYLIMKRHRDWVSDEGISGDILGAAIQYTDEAFLQYLLSLGVQQNLRNSRGNPALIHALHHESEREGERNWFFMANHGASELEAVCSIESNHLQDIEENAPRWFASKVTELRPLCTGRR